MSMMVAPVEVKPDMVSKKALATPLIWEVNRKGSIPTRQNRIQLMQTIMYPSRRPITFCAPRPRNFSKAPIAKPIKVAYRKGFRSSSSYRKDIRVQSSSKPVSTKASVPRIFATNLKFNMALSL